MLLTLQTMIAPGEDVREVHFWHMPLGVAGRFVDSRMCKSPGIVAAESGRKGGIGAATGSSAPAWEAMRFIYDGTSR